MEKTPQPFQSGQTVTTDFYDSSRNRDTVLEVLSCYASDYCQSGWMMDVKNPESGKKLTGVDSAWFKKK